MNLLLSSPLASVEFASMSLLLKNEATFASGEALIVPCPLTTMQASVCHDCINELHTFLRPIVAKFGTTPSTGSTNRRLPAAQQLCVDDATLTDEEGIQLFRSSLAGGVGLYFLITRDPNTINTAQASLLNHKLRNSHAQPNPMVGGVLWVVAVSGRHYFLTSNTCTLARRLQDVTSWMRHKIKPTADPEQVKQAVRALLTTICLTEDEERRTNHMVDSEAVSMVQDESVDEADTPSSSKVGVPKVNILRKTGSRSSRRGLVSSSSSDVMRMSLALTNSADMARIISDRVAVLSVAEKDSKLRSFAKTGSQRRAATETLVGKKRTRKRKSGDEPDLKDFSFDRQQKHEAASNHSPGSIATKNGSQAPKGAAGIKQPKGGFVETTTKDQGKKGGIAPLARPSKDNLPQNRRRSIATGGNSAPSTTSNQTQQPQKAFDVFGTGEEETNTASNFGQIPFPGIGEMDFAAPAPAPASAAADAFPSSPDPVLPPSMQHHHQQLPPQKPPMAAPFSQPPSQRSFGMDFGSTGLSTASIPQYASAISLDFSEATDATEPSSELNSTARARIQVNVALNEDLTCSYRNSRISSCQIEGVVQVQVRPPELITGTPFLLLLRDPSRHIRAIQENKRYADDVGELLGGDRNNHSEDDDGVDFKYSIKVPRAENYYPVMRYKCATDLRPVPIRVQTRTRLSGGYCRVALQISSNPANEDNLTDLTIIMGVPQEVRGESLTTVPPGGVWNEQRRSVIWCVAELGSGEKFQLQATFELSGEVRENEKPKFPVLVRCQCMYAQLSDVEIEVADIPEVFPADVTMKLARRFRLSHRERS